MKTSCPVFLMASYVASGACSTSGLCYARTYLHYCTLGTQKGISQVSRFQAHVTGFEEELGKPLVGCWSVRFVQNAEEDLLISVKDFLVQNLDSFLFPPPWGHIGRSTRNSNPVMTSSAGMVPRVDQTTGPTHPQPTLPHS